MRQWLRETVHWLPRPWLRLSWPPHSDRLWRCAHRYARWVVDHTHTHTLTHSYHVGVCSLTVVLCAQEAEAETAARLAAAERALERRAGEVEHLQLQVSTLKADRHTLERDRAAALAELEELTSRLGAPLLLRLRTEGPTAVASLEQLQQLQRLEAMRDEAQQAVCAFGTR